MYICFYFVCFVVVVVGFFAIYCHLAKKEPSYQGFAPYPLSLGSPERTGG
jgi:hypothetical protein